MQWGLTYFFTFGLCGIGWLVDMFQLPSIVEKANAALHHEEEEKEPYSLVTAYKLWLPFGVVGFHRYAPISTYPYPHTHIHIHPPPIHSDVDPPMDPSPIYYNASLEHVRYYLGDHWWGLFYTLTAGIVGLGFLHDLFFMPKLVFRANTLHRHQLEQRARMPVAFRVESPPPMNPQVVPYDIVVPVAPPHPPPAYNPQAVYQEQIEGDHGGEEGQ